MKRLIVSAAILCFSGSLSATLAGVKSLGMAGAVAANPQDALVIAYNPAGITALGGAHGGRLDFGAIGVFSRAKLTVSDSLFPFADVNKSHSNHKRWLVSPDIGFVQRVWKCVSVGLAAYNEKEVHVRYGEPLPLLGTSRPGMEYIQEVIAPTVAVDLGWGQTLGLSVDWVVQRLKVTGLENIVHPPLAPPGFSFSEFPNNVTNQHYDYSQGCGVKVGWRGDFLGWISLGASYAPKVKMSRLKRYKGFVAGEGRLDVPDIIRAGIAVYPYRGVTLEVDYELIRYGMVKSLHNSFIPNLFVSRMGEEDGAAFGWNNQHIWRFGANWNINCEWSVRAGFRHANLQFDPSNTLPNVFTVDTCVDLATIGASWRFSEDFELSILGVYGINRKSKGDIPLVAFFGGHVEVEQQRTGFGLSLAWVY